MFRTLVDPLFDEYDFEEEDKESVGNILFRETIRQPRHGTIL